MTVNTFHFLVKNYIMKIKYPIFAYSSLWILALVSYIHIKNSLYFVERLLVIIDRHMNASYIKNSL